MVDTPTKVLFIQTPTIGEITVWARFVVPVKNANTVPSIFLGVILANIAIIGRVPIAKPRAPNIVSVKII